MLPITRTLNGSVHWKQEVVNVVLISILILVDASRCLFLKLMNKAIRRTVDTRNIAHEAADLNLLRVETELIVESE